MDVPLILASASPRRRELLERIGIEFQVCPANVDESVLAGEEAVPYARRVALAKAARVAGDQPEAWVLAADTVVEVDGVPLGKASDDAEAQSMLRRLRAREHRVTTAMALARGSSEPVTRTVTTRVYMSDFPDAELDDYVRAGEWRGKAGAYAIQGMAAVWVREIRGSVTNVIGLPLAELGELFQELAIAGPQFTRGQPA